MATLSNEAIKQQAIELVKSEKNNWKDATAFVTDRVSFQMRNLIKKARKNYWGIFESPRDPITGQKKIFVPLTQSTCESVVKNIDLDTKDINFRAKKASAVQLTAIVRQFVRNRLDDIYFGEYLDELERNLTIDGTAVWKTVWFKGEKDKWEFKIHPVDLLNLYIDPVARDIQSTTVIERSLMTQDEVSSMDEWDDTEDILQSKFLHPSDEDLNSSQRTATEGTMIEIYERWGLMPKSLMTGNKEDADEMVEGHIVVSGTNSAWKVHLIEENDGVKPYTDFWMRRVTNRYYGIGTAEQLIPLQEWLNAVINIRINRARVSQLGIFKIRRGAGITAQMVSRLASNGAITVNNPDDIVQMPMQDASPASYQDEQVIKEWSQQITQAFDVATGENLPASTPATNAAIQSRSAQSAFVLIKEQIGMGLQRWLKQQILPNMFKNMRKGEVLRLSGEPAEIRELDEMVVNQLLFKAIEKMDKQGKIVDPESVARERQKLEEKLKNMGKDRFMKLKSDFDPGDYDVQVFVTNEEMDKAVLANNLTQVLQVAPEFKDVIISQIFDLMGLDVAQLQTKVEEVEEEVEAQEAPQAGPQAAPQAAGSIQQLLTQAGTAQGQPAPQA